MQNPHLLAWQYNSAPNTPVMGPAGRLSRGTGHTSPGSALPGNAANIPGYAAQAAFEPSGLTYQPPLDQGFQRPLPRSIGTGEDGRGLVGTYQPHDNVLGVRFLTAARSSPNWQIMEYPHTPRPLLQRQQVMRYRVDNTVQLPRPLARSDYFLGYKTDMAVASQLGATGLGSM